MIQIKKIELDRDKILKQLANLSELIESDKWKLEYDAELDELFFGIDTMPKNSFLFNINDELNLFVTPDSKIYGIFVEYFANNYIEHNMLARAIGSVANMKKIFVAVNSV